MLKKPSYYTKRIKNYFIRCTKRIKNYFIRLNGIVKELPKWRRILIGLGTLVCAAFFACVPFIPLGFFLGILGLKILWDVWKDWRVNK